MPKIIHKNINTTAIIYQKLVTVWIENEKVELSIGIEPPENTPIIIDERRRVSAHFTWDELLELALKEGLLKDS